MISTKESKSVEFSVPKKLEEMVERYPAPAELRRSILVKPQVLMGSGPTNPTKRVTEALSKPVMGLYSPELHQVSVHFVNT